MRFAGLIALPLLALVSVPAARPLAASQAPVGATLDLVVTGADGRPVADLQPSDLIIRIDGRPQTVTGVRTAPPTAPTVRAGLPLPYGTNVGLDGRTTAVLVDVARLTPDRSAAITAGLTALTAAVSPTDRVALIPMSTDLRPVDFTTTHSRIVDAAAALTLHTGAPRTSRQDATAVDAMLTAVTRATTLLGGEPGVKTLVLVTAPFVISGDLRQSVLALGEAVARHRIALYVVAPGAAAIPPANGVHALAAGTGGLVVTGAWSEIVARERARVEVTLAPDMKLDAGAVSRALITSTRAGVVVRGAPFAFVPLTETDGLVSLTDMLRRTRPFTDLPMRVAAYPVLHTDRSSIRLLIVAETIENARPLAWAEFALITPDGRMVAQWTEEREAVTQHPLVAGVLAPEGQYRLRWAASELSGRRGTADVDVDVRLTPAGVFRLSALMVGRLGADDFVPVLQPAADAPAIEWYAEVYGPVEAGQVLTTRLDVLTTPAGPPVASAEGRMLTSPDPQRRALSGQVPVADLGPGDYLLRATLMVNGVDAGSVTHTLRRGRE
ncbi:MAG: hypothetical protein FJW21_03970 [Acidimicrobiia bacterium]|nr:hypothetical protein [Acidimicrobiia bacterium]